MHIQIMDVIIIKLQLIHLHHLIDVHISRNYRDLTISMVQHAMIIKIQASDSR